MRNFKRLNEEQREIKKSGERWSLYANKQLRILAQAKARTEMCESGGPQGMEKLVKILGVSPKDFQMAMAARRKQHARMAATAAANAR